MWAFLALVLLGTQPSMLIARQQELEPSDRSAGLPTSGGTACAPQCMPSCAPSCTVAANNPDGAGTTTQAPQELHSTPRTSAPTTAEPLSHAPSSGSLTNATTPAKRPHASPSETPTTPVGVDGSAEEGVVTTRTIKKPTNTSSPAGKNEAAVAAAEIVAAEAVATQNANGNAEAGKATQPSPNDTLHANSSKVNATETQTPSTPGSGNLTKSQAVSTSKGSKSPPFLIIPTMVERPETVKRWPQASMVPLGAVSAAQKFRKLGVDESQLDGVEKVFNVNTKKDDLVAIAAPHTVAVDVNTPL